MGFRIGNDRELASRLGEIGLLAGATAVLAVGGTIGAILLAELLVLRSRRPAPVASVEAGHGASGRAEGGTVEPSAPAAKAGGLGHLKAPLVLLGVVAAGFLLGLLLPPPPFDLSLATGWALNGLLFFIGMQFAQAGVSLKEAFLKPEVLVVPLATAVGSLAGCLLLAPIFSLGIGKALSLGAGFGWYSLSGVIIADMGDPALGSAAFLANMLRESIALVTIPFLASSRIPELAVGVGGATAMDVTLPLIEQCAGPRIVPLSFASGALLSLSVPLLVPLFMRLPV